MQDAALRVAVMVRVVDNFGDAGVAWRLARQLRAEHGAEVTLWIDAPEVLARLARALVVEGVTAGVHVRRLPPRDAATAVPLAPWPQVIVEAFGSGLPAAWLDAIERAQPAPVWIHLEYLSAEAWVDGAHGLPSPHPSRRLLRWFYYPGFTPRTGGLLRERGLPHPHPADRAVAWAEAGLPAPPADALAVSLFCYSNVAVKALLTAWAQGTGPVYAIVPEGVAEDAVVAFLGAPAVARDVHRVGALTLAVVPFVDQEAFDRRLAACDLAIVRGEDSFVCAQWAGVPFVWHIYPQDDDAHRVKLDAFIARYAAGLDDPARTAWVAFTHAFNAADENALAQAWPALRDALPALRSHTRHWAASLAARPDLASQLVGFARTKL